MEEEEESMNVMAMAPLPTGTPVPHGEQRCPPPWLAAREREAL